MAAPSLNKFLARPHAQPGLLGIKVTRQGKVSELITKGGLKSDGHNLPIGLKSGPVGSAIEIAERGAHFAADTKGIVECAARTQTRQQEVVIGGLAARTADGNDLAVALQQDFGGTLERTTEVDSGFPIATKAGVEDTA